MLKRVFLILLPWLLVCTAEFTDEMLIHDLECLGEEKFPCGGGGCVHQSQYCDGKIDCEDGTDEDFCPNHVPDPELCNMTHQFLCHDKKRCIPNTWICNNDTECEDGSDEFNCTDTLEPNRNSTCIGFQCGDGKCISKLWTCDGRYDCEDKSDENDEELCRHALEGHRSNDGLSCNENPTITPRRYSCVDKSFCLKSELMCNGLADCRDGSDEGPFCDNWKTMCDNFTCSKGESYCSPERHGPSCRCVFLKSYNYTAHRCEDVDECAEPRPQCSQRCDNADGHFRCSCSDGYKLDMLAYLCYAPEPEAMLFFSTRNDIRYVKVKSKEQVIVATGIKQAHGVSYGGKYLYWVEMAQGHQAIVRAHLENVDETKEVIVGLGLEDPGDVSVDWLGGNIYFSDADRGSISACKADGSVCTTLTTHARHPRFVTLDPTNGMMYWADWHSRPLIMQARMDGTNATVLVDNLDTFATGLTVDVPNGRLYYVDRTIKVVKIDDKQIYSLFEEPFHHPYAISVFENTVFWSDWTSNTIQTTDKLHGTTSKRNILLSLDMPVFDMHMYHPVLMNGTNNPCAQHNCSHMCLVTSAHAHVCACPEGMGLYQNGCLPLQHYKPQYLVVGGGSTFTRVEYNTLGNPETHGTNFDIGRVQAMAYDNTRDTLYLYDGQRKTINYINMTEFSLGVTHLLEYRGLDNVLDMDYDYVSDSLYFVDEGRGFIEAFSLRTLERAIIYRFKDYEKPISLCVLPDYGRMLVAVIESEQNNEIHVESIGLDGSDRQHVITNNLKGPHVRLQYAPRSDIVYISDEGNGVIDYIHPEGTGRELYRELSTTVTSLSVTDIYVFWTDRRTPRLFWSPVHETMHNRRINLSIFPNNTQLHIQATSPPPNPKNVLSQHPCLTTHPCSHVCVQTPHPPIHQAPTNFLMKYKCLCPPGLLLIDGQCTKLATCKENELYCHRSNSCFMKTGLCDGKNDCVHGEDEEGCPVPSTEPHEVICASHEIKCRGECVDKSEGCPSDAPVTNKCEKSEFRCISDGLCVDRSVVCDGEPDCPDGSDEGQANCDTLACLDTEFMCTSGSCILSSWKCDGDQDCSDGSDEVNCENRTCSPGYYQCRNGECIELRKRCDGQQDCFDFTDEEECDEPVILDTKEELPHCTESEIMCELNRSICIPITARCNMKTDCPGGTDESGCDFLCHPRGMFECKQELKCLAMAMVCDGHKHCHDGTDETPEACAKVNKTSHLFPPPLYPAAECTNGFLCRNGQCIEWREVCDHTPNCFDGSDENGLCFTACENNTCPFSCQPTPSGPHCLCGAGFRTQADHRTCVDVDECPHEMCSQHCHNIPGSFLCSCHHGYALRSDRRSCKATKGNMSILYISGNSVKSISADGYGTTEYHDANTATITDMDFNVRKKLLYVSSTDAGKLIEVNETKNDIVITNVGKPTRVAVDWVTGNVYFVDSTPGASCIRVCDVHNNRCAKLHKLPTDAKVTALIVDPGSRRMFYCVTHLLESVVWSASLAGLRVTDLTTVRNCTGLAVDSFKRRLYVAETGPAHIMWMDFDGDKHEKVVGSHRHVDSPHGLAIFEDYIYFLVANSFQMSRCQLYADKHCEPYLYRVFDANTFVIRHESVQRDDIANICDGVVCSNVCALDESGPQCVCEGGSISKDGNCPFVKQEELALFNGWSRKDYKRASQYSFTLIYIVLALFILYLISFGLYHSLYRPWKKRSAAYAGVRFQNTTSDGEGFTSSDPAIEISTQGRPENEFVNPLQFVRDFWRQSFRRNRPIGTAGLSFEVPNMQEDLSDTESDLDDREHKKIIRRK